MPPLLRRSLQCHYCGQKSGRRYDGSIRSWICTNCEAVNYLDADGQITDPPASATPKQSSLKYGRVAHRSTSPDLSPQGNDIFCKQCLTNQHLVQQNLAEYLPAPNDPKYNKFVQSYEAYKEGLESRYPQVCANCAPRVNERLKATTYAAKADHLRRGLAKRKPSPFAPEWRKWGWQRILVFVGGIAWWASVLGQAMWHLQGILPPAEKQRELRNTSWCDQWICMSSDLLFRESQLSCLDATRETAWRALYAGMASLWWNNKLSKKLYSPGRSLQGIYGYLMTQILTLSIRGAALYVLADSSILPSNIPKIGVHGAALVFMAFTTLLSLTSVKLTEPRRPNLTNHHPVHVEQYNVGPAAQHNRPRSAHSTVKSTVSFPVSVLARPQAPSPYAASSTPQSSSLFADNSDNEMDWTPTAPSQYATIKPKQPTGYQRPAGPNPFATLPPDPVRRPGQLRPFMSASEQLKQNFMSEIRGELRVASGSPPRNDDDDNWILGRSKKSSLVLGPGKLRDLPAENAATGLEGLFNSAFTIKEDPIEHVQEQVVQTHRHEKGYVIDGETVRENFIVMRAGAALAALSIAALGLCIGLGWIDMKAFIEGLLYQKEVVAAVHEVVEEVMTEVAETQNFG